MRRNKSEAGYIREAERKAARDYCLLFKVHGVDVCCYKCPLCKNDNDCRGNLIGTYALKLARARAAVIELPSNTGHERKNER